jgi:hypothetical protein
MKLENLYKIIDLHAPFGVKYFTFTFLKIPSTKFFKKEIDSGLLKNTLADFYSEKPLYFIQSDRFNENAEFYHYHESMKLVVILKEGLILEQTTNNISLYYDDRISSEELDSLKKVIDEASPDQESPKFFMIKKNQYGDFELVNFEIKQKNISVPNFYNDSLGDVHEKLRSFLLEADSNGIILFHGSPGTGKTSYIRHLISSVQCRFIYIPNNLFEHLSDPDFISFVSSFPDSTIILEDCEELLRSRIQQSNDAGISNLLNLGDGLLGDALRLKIICTFNCDLSRIDEAILRKGRLAYRYEFGPLNTEKANNLFSLLGINAKTEVPMSLAEIFNYEHDNQTDDLNRPSIGF